MNALKVVLIIMIIVVIAALIYRFTADKGSTVVREEPFSLCTKSADQASVVFYVLNAVQYENQSFYEYIVDEINQQLREITTSTLLPIIPQSMQIQSFDNNNGITMNTVGIDLQNQIINIDATMYLQIPQIILNQSIHVEDIILQIDGNVVLKFEQNQIIVDIQSLENVRVIHMNADTQYKQLLVELINNVLHELFHSFHFQVQVDTSLNIQAIFQQICSYVDCKC